MRKSFAAAALALFLPMAAHAMGFGNDTGENTYDMGYQKAMDGDFDGAVMVLQAVVSEDPKNADAWNMLGYSYRNQGKADEAWDAYERALALDPEHKGAHEYIGEWYLMQGDVASAKAQLEKLHTLCPSGCVEVETLEASIAKAEGNS
ncbi:tetratricopeptide repeat protein [Pacificispira spongiicola]|nr:tetratricopeptide repeat protein [Pacificispira spongiicola]